MKFATVSVSISKALVLGSALLLASSAFAATKANLQLASAVTVNGNQLKPGDYKVTWEGSGPNVELSITQGKNVVAKVPAHVVELKTEAPQDAAITQKNGNGPDTLTAVRFHGKKISLEFGEASGGMQAGSSE
jgi:hypothetical protein